MRWSGGPHGDLLDADLPPGASAQPLLTVPAPLPRNKEKQRQLTVTAAPT